MMNGHIRTFLIATVLGTSLLAHAAELDKKQTGVLGRASNQITAALTSLATYGPDKRGLTTRLAEDFARKVARFEEMLAPLPADNEEVKKELAHLAELKKAVAEQTAALASDNAAKEGEKDSIRAALEGPEAAAELEALTQLLDMFKSAKRFELDFYAYSRWPTHSMVAELRSWAEGWSASQKKFAELSAKYEPIVAYKGNLGGQASMNQAKVIIALREAKQYFVPFKSNIETFAKEAPAQIDKEGAALKGASDAAVAGKDYNAFIQNEGKIEALRYRITNLANVWGPLAASDDERKKVEARSKALLTEADQEMEKLATLIIKENKGPKDKYAGSDRSKLEAYVRAAWAKKFPNETIVAVRFAGSDFERQVSWRYDAAARAFIKSDSSSLPVWIVVKYGAKQGIMWFAEVFKMHLRGDSLAMDWVDRSSRGPLPNQRLFLSNL